MMKGPDPVDLPINGTLDLHYFSPGEVDELIPEYLKECLKRGIHQVRIVHGKGTGTMRRKVHSILGRLQEVDSFSMAGENAGGWGATIVNLRYRDI